jgi:hypothetical protein
MYAFEMQRNGTPHSLDSTITLFVRSGLSPVCTSLHEVIVYMINTVPLYQVEVSPQNTSNKVFKQVTNYKVPTRYSYTPQNQPHYNKLSKI